MRALSSCPSQGLAFQPDLTFRYFFARVENSQGLDYGWALHLFFANGSVSLRWQCHGKALGHQKWLQAQCLAMQFWCACFEPNSQASAISFCTTGPIDGGLFLASRPSWIQKIFGESAESSASKNGSVVLLCFFRYARRLSVSTWYYLVPIYRFFEKVVSLSAFQ